MYYLTGIVKYGEGWFGGNPEYKFYTLYFGEKGFMSVGEKDIELMLCLNREDENGKLIYEGDVMHVHDKISGRFFEVTREDNGFGLVDAKGEGDDWGVYTRNIELRNDKFLIIGNRYENPELVK